jgi:hypothetical protein
MELHPCRGEGDAAREPLEQFQAQLLFERPDMATDRSMGEMKLFGSTRHAEQPASGLEGAKRLHRRESIEHAED